MNNEKFSEADLTLLIRTMGRPIDSTEWQRLELRLDAIDKQKIEDQAMEQAASSSEEQAPPKKSGRRR